MEKDFISSSMQLLCLVVLLCSTINISALLMSDAYVLKYFDGRGVIENVRVMFNIAGQSFEDIRYPIDMETFAKPEFDADKAKGDFALNMDRLPLLSYNGNTIGQSKSIERFVAKKLGFLGSSDVEAATIDMLCEHVVDIKKKYSDCKTGLKGDELEAAKVKWATEEMPVWMKKLELCASPVGSTPTLFDIVIYACVYEFFDTKELAIASITECPKLKASCDLVTEKGGAYFAARKVTKL